MSTFEALPRDESPIRRSMRPGALMSKMREVRLPMIALVALAGLATGIFATATQPQTTPLRHEVTALTGALNSTHQQISALQSSLAHAVSQGTRLRGAVGSLRHRVRAFESAEASVRHGVAAVSGVVGSLQNRIEAVQGSVGRLARDDRQLYAERSSLLTCVLQLQQELNGLQVKATSGGARITSASSASLPRVSPPCTKPFLDQRFR